MIWALENLDVARAKALALRAALGLLWSVSAWAQGPFAPEQQAPVASHFAGPPMMWALPYPGEMYVLPEFSPAEQYACYRIGRCSAYDLYRFRDRPNRLTRLAPEAPPRERDAVTPAIPYWWYLVPVTPEENIRPQYRAASQVRDEYRAVGRPIDGRN